MATQASIPVSQPQIADLQPYQPGMSIATLAKKYNLDPANIIKLASNENSLGMSPLVKAASTALWLEAFRYPNGQALQQDIARHYHLEEATVILGNGSNDVLDLVARVFLGSGSEAISSQYAFAIYRILTQTAGAKNVVTKAKDYGHDLDAMLAAITPKTRVIWMANPNNPTGTFVEHEAVRAFLRAVPPEVIVVLDEAYYEYLDSPRDTTGTTTWLSEFPNVIITRTFSKAYGLAGLRVGYGLAHESLITLMHRVRQPFNVNELGLGAAMIALRDQDFVRRSQQHNKNGLKQLKDGFDQLKLAYLPAFGNFITVRFANARCARSTSG